VKAFVTGGTGFVGAHLVQALRARGDTVTCLVRSPAKAAALGWSDVRLVRGDLDDEAALLEGSAGADVIYHVAGRISARDGDEFMRANRDGTANVLEAASAHPPQRFVLVSSLAAAGPATPGAPIDETRPPAPVTPYGQSKLAAEVLVRGMAPAWTIVRPPMVYGEWDRELLKAFRLARAGIVPVFGDGSQELSVIYAGDLAAALVAAAGASAAANRLYYAAHPRVTTSRELVRAIGRSLGGKRGRGRGRAPRIVPLPGAVARGLLWVIGSVAHLAGRATLLSSDKAAEFLAPAWTCRPDALQRDTGWQAATDLESGLRRTADWYRREGWL
jgi:nucleoside-diphosphate-sugar epimerase